MSARVVARGIECISSNSVRVLVARSNPDLLERWRRGASLNAPQLEHFYAGEEKGYIDYPTLEAVTV
jgi:hypothetical protein